MSTKKSKMEILKNLLSKLPKGTLVTIIILLGGMYSNEKIKENAVKQQEIINNQKIIQLKMNTGFINLSTDINELRLKQNIVIETLPPIDREMIKQIKNIYDQMREDQSKRDREKMDNKNESYLEPIEPVDPIFPLLVNNKK